MNRYIVTSDDEVKVIIGAQPIVKLTATNGGDLIEGFIREGHDFRLTSYDLIEVASWLLEKAKERAREKHT